MFLFITSSQHRDHSHWFAEFNWNVCWIYCVEGRPSLLLQVASTTVQCIYLYFNGSQGVLSVRVSSSQPRFLRKLALARQKHAQLNTQVLAPAACTSYIRMEAVIQQATIRVYDTRSYTSVYNTVSTGIYIHVHHDSHGQERKYSIVYDGIPVQYIARWGFVRNEASNVMCLYMMYLPPITYF
jgi:hypothetical protein